MPAQSPLDARIGVNTPAATPQQFRNAMGISDQAYSDQVSGNSTDLSRFGANPYASPLAGMASSINSYSPTPMTNGNGAYVPTDYSKTSLPQYDAIRQRIGTQFNQTQQLSQEALDRQFAAMGGGPGNGVQLKQTENLAADIGKQRADAMLGVDSQEAQERQQMQEAEKGRAFQANMFNAQNAMDTWKTKLTAGIGLNTTLAQLNTGWDEAQQESINNKFNRELATQQANHSGGALGGGGFLGTGIGA